MGEKVLMVAIDGGVTHFASSKEKVKVKVNEPAPPGMKIDKLSFLVTDCHGALVYKEVWPGSAVTGSEKAAKNASGGPPTSFEWDGQNNQLDPISDDKKATHTPFANPLGSPYALKALAELSKGKESKPPPENMATSTDILPCQKPESEEDEPPKPKLVSLLVSCAGGSSQSFTLQDALVGSLPILADKQKRFCFASGEEKSVKLVWKIEHEARSATGQLELFSAKQKAAIWTYALGNAALKKLSLDRAGWDGNKQSTRVFFDELLTLKDSPYKLKLTLAGDEVEAGLEVAWTYVDVLVDSIELSWGEARLLPAAKPPTADPAFKDLALKEELLLLRELKGLAAIADPHSETLIKLTSDDTSAAVKKLDPKQDQQLELRSNLFYQKTTEWDDGTQFKKYQKCWGSGPRLPIFAQVKLRSASGAGVASKTALDGVQLVWDWEDPSLDKEIGVETPGFVKWAYNHKHGLAPERRYDADSPSSTNCPKDFGGKLGDPAAPIFPTETGGAVVKVGEFPFKVEACPGRKWAALSTVYTGADKAYVGKTGVIFQPSRMAGDTYRVRAYLYTGDPKPFEAKLSGAEIWQAAEQARLPRAASGSFEVWRRVDILRYYKKNAALPAIDWKQINAKFEGARLRLHPPAANDGAAVGKLWGAAFDNILGGLAADVGGQKRVNLCVRPQNPADGYMLTSKTWTAWLQPAVDGALTLLGKPTGTSFWAVHDTLTNAELDTLNGHLGTHLFGNPGQAHPDMFTPSIIDCATNFDGIAKFFTNGSITGTWFKDNLLGPLIGKYIQDPAALTSAKGVGNLIEHSGLHVFHFQCALATSVDSKGSAFALLPDLFGGKPADAGKQGMFYFNAPPGDSRVEIHAHKKDDFAGGADSIIPGRLEIAYFPLFVSTLLATDPGLRPDFEGAMACLVNAAAFKVLEQTDAQQVLFPEFKKKKSETDSLAWERNLDLWKDYIHIGVKGGGKAAIDMFTSKLAEYREVFVQPQLLVGIPDERNVYISRFATFDAAKSAFVRFPNKGSDLSAKDGGVRIYEKLLGIVRDLYKRTPRPIVNLFVYSGQSTRARQRSANVSRYVEGLGNIIVQKVKINIYADLRPVANDHSEREIYVSLERPFNKAQATCLRFSSSNANLYKNGLNGELSKFVSGALTSGTALLPPVYVYYKDSKWGNRRRVAVCNYLDALFEQQGRQDTALDEVYELDALVAHELAHTLFLQHAPPETTGAAWPHVKNHNCLMNYDASETEFCGLCLLQMRGWDVGTSDAGKLGAGPPYTGAKPLLRAVNAPTTPQPMLVIPPRPQPPELKEHTVGLVLDDEGLVGEPRRVVNGCAVTLVNVWPQGGPEGGHNTCGFHSLKNALFLHKHVELISAQLGTAAVQPLVAQLGKDILETPDAENRFKEVFLNGGSVGHPSAQSWLKICQDKGGMPGGPDQSIGAEHQQEILTKLAANAGKLPTGVALGAAAAVGVNLDFGPSGGFELWGGAEVGAAIKVLREMQAAGKRTRAFTCAVGAHFITVVAHKFKAGAHDTELIVADSLNRSYAANDRAVRGVAAWIQDDGTLAMSTWEHNFFADWRNRLPKTAHDIKQPDASGLAIDEIEQFVGNFEDGVAWLQNAGLLADPGFAETAGLIKTYILAFEARLGVLNDLVKGPTVVQQCLTLKNLLP